jgi:hypothetical protein
MPLEMQTYSGGRRPVARSIYCWQIVIIDRIDATNAAGRTNARIKGIAARMKVMSVKTSATVNRKKSVMV